MSSDPSATAHHVQVDRLARALWRLGWLGIEDEAAREEDWCLHIDSYRRLAKTILTTPDGWKTVSEVVWVPRIHHGETRA